MSHNLDLHAFATQEIASLATGDPALEIRKQRLIATLASSEGAFARHLRGHITVSAIVYRADTDALLMIFHAKLQRWLFPGGHVEEISDQSLLAAARRECLEETGLDPVSAGYTEPVLIDIDIHEIPANAREPAHAHLDVRYLFRVQSRAPLLDGAAWVARSETIAHFPESLARPARAITI